jgi:hypothetical protein
MPHDGKTYMRCKRSGKKPDVKNVTSAPLGDEKKKDDKKKKHWIHEWAAKQIEVNGFIELLNVLLIVVSIGFGIYYGYTQSSGPHGMYLILAAQKVAVWLRSFFIKPTSSIVTSSSSS